MNLHGIAAGVVGAVNPHVPARLLPSRGWTTQGDGTRVPAYGPPVDAMAQVQSLTFKDLQMVSGLNIQGEARAIYLNGDWRGVIRADKAGGDVITIGAERYLVVQALETWPDWSKVAVVRQVC
ncbi:MAG: hypothetical protein K2X46_06180 [Roseomonas sp.]|nr:hypothetical protein [Roseomonas sp.]